MGHGIALMIIAFVGLCFMLWPNAMPHIARGLIFTVLGLVAIVAIFLGYVAYNSMHRTAASRVSYLCTGKGHIVLLDKNGQAIPHVIDVPKCRQAICDLAWWDEGIRARYGERCAGRVDW